MQSEFNKVLTEQQDHVNFYFAENFAKKKNLFEMDYWVSNKIQFISLFCRREKLNEQLLLWLPLFGRWKARGYFLFRGEQRSFINWQHTEARSSIRSQWRQKHTHTHICMSNWVKYPLDSESIFLNYRGGFFPLAVI